MQPTSCIIDLCALPGTDDERVVKGHPGEPCRERRSTLNRDIERTLQQSNWCLNPHDKLAVNRPRRSVCDPHTGRRQPLAVSSGLYHLLIDDCISRLSLRLTPGGW